jgi:pantoate--beta-alanine ligase
MKIIDTIPAMRKARQELRGTVGFVPTMGCLHDGHLALVRSSRKENEYSIASIFVNPAQFGPAEDFGRYPRDYPHDLGLLGKEKVDLVFMPTTAEMYPQGYDTWVEVKQVTERLEGAIRPGHFRGVATIVTKLFNVIGPTRSYFGQKDAQQCVVIRKMINDMNMDMEMIVVPTVRMPDGLAMSSRNVYLNPEERRQAPVLYKALSTAHVMWSEGERDSDRLRQAIVELIQQKPLGQIDYISVANKLTLDEIDKAEPPAILSLAVKFGNTRLLDNIILE